jgi:tRNA uridine 5-carboxymethylaminomethyl modification enzyme
LCPIGVDLDLYTSAERERIDRRLADEDAASTLARDTSVSPDRVNALLERIGSAPVHQSARIAELAKRQRVSLEELFAVAEVTRDFEPEALITAELELKYAGYFVRERDQAAKLRRMGAFALAADLPYEAMSSLSFESRQKLGALRPGTLAQAARVPGVSPTDLQNLVIEVEKWRRRGAASALKD